MFHLFLGNFRYFPPIDDNKNIAPKPQAPTPKIKKGETVQPPMGILC